MRGAPSSLTLRVSFANWGASLESVEAGEAVASGGGGSARCFVSEFARDTRSAAANWAVAGGQGQQEEDKHEGDGSDVNNNAQWESLDALENSMDADAAPLDSP